MAHLKGHSENHRDQNCGVVGKNRISGLQMFILASEWRHTGEGALGTIESFCRAQQQEKDVVGGCCLIWPAMQPGSQWIDKDAR